MLCSICVFYLLRVIVCWVVGILRVMKVLLSIKLMFCDDFLTILSSVC